jgi:predicted O-methyltransferase YrrM
MSDEAIWKAVDHYIVESLVAEDPVLEAALKANKAAGLPSIDVSPAQGALLNLRVRMNRARTVLEIGTLGGYSTLWMAKALPADGRLISLEYSERHAEVARSNIQRAELPARVEVRVGRAVDLLPGLEPEAPFDFVFIDADKPSNAAYIEWALRLSRPGTVIVVDNVIRDGEVIQQNSTNASVQGSRAAFERIGREGRLSATAIQTVGAKGYDGFAIAIVGG